MALKAIRTLVRLHKRRIDVLRREMLALEEECRQLLNVSEQLRKDLLREQELAMADLAMAAFLPSYTERVKERQAKIAMEVMRLGKLIQEKVEAIRDEFGEQKKMEIAEKHNLKLLEEKAKRMQNQRFDEIASQQYVKKQEHPI